MLHFSIGRDTDQQLELVVRGVQPEYADQDGKDDGAHGINPPAQLTAANGRQDTESVDDQIIAVVLPQDADLGNLVAQREAVDEQSQLGREGNHDSDHGGKVEFARRRGRAHRQLAHRKRNQDERHRSHEETEADIARRLDPRLTRRELARVHPVDSVVTGQQREIRHGIENRVCHGGEQRQRARRDGAVQLQHRQEDIGRETGVHGDLVLQLVIQVDLARIPHMLLDGLEHPLDILILHLIEPLQFGRRRQRPVGVLNRRSRRHGRPLHAVITTTPRARTRHAQGLVPLARGIGLDLDLADLVLGLELGGELEGVIFGSVPRRLGLFISNCVPVMLFLILDFVEFERCAGGCVVGHWRGVVLVVVLPGVGVVVNVEGCRMVRHAVAEVTVLHCEMLRNVSRMPGKNKNVEGFRWPL